MAVLWTHFCVDRTAIYGSFMDTFFSPTKLPYMEVLWTLFGCLSPKPTKLRTLAVLWTLFSCRSPPPFLVPQNCHIYGSSMDTNFETNKTAIYGSFMDTFRLSEPKCLQNCGP